MSKFIEMKKMSAEDLPILFIDSGNTRIKIWIQNKKEKEYIHIFNFYSKMKISKKTFFNIISRRIMDEKINIKEINYILICSVTPSNEKLFLYLGKKINAKILRAKKELNPPIIKQLEMFRDIGADILMSSYGFLSEYKNSDGILLNLGTATTITLIKNNKIEGSIILPGVQMQLNSIVKELELISSFKILENYNKAVGKNTNQSLTIGLINSKIITIKNLIKKIEKEYSLKNLKKVFLGGEKLIENKIQDLDFTKNDKLIIYGLKKCFTNCFK